MFKYCLYRFGLFLLKRLPFRVSYRLAALLSDAQYALSFRDRNAVKNNLKKILPAGQNVSVVARKVFRNFGRYLIEFFQMKEMVDERFITDKVRVQGINFLDDVLAKGKGGIVITAHIGNWELGAVVINALGYPLMAVALPHKERPVNDLFNHQREAKGIVVVPTNMALRRCMEQLKDNKLVALVADRDFSSHGIVMDFLGHKALIPKGAAVLSWKTGAPIVPTFLIRNRDGTFTLSCHEPLDPPAEDSSLGRDEVILGIMRRYMSVIEEKIRAYPSQWLLFREFCAE